MSQTATTSNVIIFYSRPREILTFHPIDYRVYSKQIRWNLEDPHDDLIKATVMLENEIVMKIESFSLFPAASREAPPAGGMRGFANFRFFFLDKKIQKGFRMKNQSSPNKIHQIMLKSMLTTLKSADTTTTWNQNEKGKSHGSFLEITTTMKKTKKSSTFH